MGYVFCHIEFYTVVLSTFNDYKVSICHNYLVNLKSYYDFYINSKAVFIVMRFLLQLHHKTASEINLEALLGLAVQV